MFNKDSNLNRVLIGCGGIGILISALVSSYIYLNSDYTIEKLLKKENNSKKRLTRGNKYETGWKERWNNYVTENSNSNAPKIKDTWALEDWTTVSLIKDQVPTSFVNKCEKLSHTRVKDKKSNKYTNYIKWCTR